MNTTPAKIASDLTIGQRIGFPVFVANINQPHARATASEVRGYERLGLVQNVVEFDSGHDKLARASLTPTGREVARILVQQPARKRLGDQPATEHYLGRFEVVGFERDETTLADLGRPLAGLADQVADLVLRATFAGPMSATPADTEAAIDAELDRINAGLDGCASLASSIDGAAAGWIRIYDDWEGVEVPLDSATVGRLRSVGASDWEGAWGTLREAAR